MKHSQTDQHKPQTSVDGKQTEHQPGAGSEWRDDVICLPVDTLFTQAQCRPLQENKGHRKVLASADINLKCFASATPTQTDLTLKLKPLSVKVVEASLRLSLSCVFVREGKAT